MERREFVLALVTTFSGLVVPKVALSQSRSIAGTYGGPGGVNGFGPILPRSIGLRFGDLVDAILINGQVHGGRGGIAAPEISLRPSEYWQSFSVKYGSYVDYLSFTTSAGETISGGRTSGPMDFVSPENARITSISGEFGSYLDRIRIEYITSFFPSRIVERDVNVVYEVVSGEQEVVEYTETNSRRLDTIKRVVEHELTFNGSASVELTDTLKASRGFTFKTTNTSTNVREAEEQLKESEKRTRRNASDEITVLSGRADIMRDSEGDYWLLPTSDAIWSTMKRDDAIELKGYFSLAPNATLVTKLNAQVVLGHERLVE